DRCDRLRGQRAKGEAMKRFLIAVCAAACLFCLYNPAARADDCCAEPCKPCHHWWHIFHHKNKCCLTCEEQRLQDFWHDYYCALSSYYKALDRIDWVAYYKNHGYQINTGCGGCGPCGGCERINYAPVFVSPTMQWAIPGGGSGGCAPGGCGPCGGPQGC